MPLPYPRKPQPHFDPGEETMPGMPNANWTWWSSYVTDILSNHDDKIDEHEVTIGKLLGRVKALEDFKKNEDRAANKRSDRLWAALLVVLSIFLTAWVTHTFGSQQEPSLADKERIYHEMDLIHHGAYPLNTPDQQPIQMPNGESSTKKH